MLMGDALERTNPKLLLGVQSNTTRRAGNHENFTHDYVIDVHSRYAMANALVKHHGVLEMTRVMMMRGR